MKTLLSLILLLSLASASAWASQDSFDCLNTIEGHGVSMNVVPKDDGFMAVFKGASLVGPVPVTRTIESRNGALAIAGIRDVVEKVQFNAQEWANVDQVVIFTYGNFEDDAAGVRGVNFLDSHKSIVKKGMYFGWAGPVSCK